MKTTKRNFLLTALTGQFDCVRQFSLILAAVLGVSLASRATATGKTFATPEEAVAALAAAANLGDSNALHVIFGPAAADLENPDRVQTTNEIRAFALALNQTNRIVRESESRCVLEVGADSWPFPVPIVKKNDQWYFDTEAGKEEMLNRRIGRNELAVLGVVRACVDAQREYASRDRDGDQVLEYAQKLSASPGRMDGLYWPPELNGEVSPLGPLVAQAQEQGYGMSGQGNVQAREPFHGYFFKVLSRQAKSVPGGKYLYIINGNMIGGFALVAWPAEYGESGIMTFIVNQQGRVYEKDLGKDTAKHARRMKAYDPDPSWRISRE